jgi:N-acetylmuramoyl-L-alanine amidase
VIVCALLLLLVALVPAAGQGEELSVSWNGSAVQVSRTATGRLELLPVLRLLGAEAVFSPAAGTWGVVRGEHQIQFTPGSRYVLIDGQLKKLDEAPVPTPAGVAASERFLDEAILEPLGFHLERVPGGLRIAEGATYRSPILVTPAGADFGATSTLVLTFDRKPALETEEREGMVVLHFKGSAPQLDESRRLVSARVRSLAVHGSDLVISLAPGTGLLGSHELDDPPRLSLDLGPARRQTAAPSTAIPPVRTTAHPVVIDPGHGGRDVGAHSPSGLEEKDLVLSVARRIARILRARGVPVRLTREGDESRALTDRTSLANRLEARVFVSLHANASPFASARGAETYYMSLEDGATDEHAAATARLENRGSGVADRKDGLDLILWEMAQAEVLNDSAKLALDVQRRLNALPQVPDRGVKQAPFVVLTGATMPAILVEVGFLTNPEEAARLADSSYQDQLARAVAEGILDYLGGS